LLAKCLSVAALAVGILLAAPADAQSPKMPQKVDIRTAQAAQISAQKQLNVFGWGQNQWGCLKELWTNESNWRPDAKNKTAVTVVKNGKKVQVHAGGIPQILGLDPKTPVHKQVRLGLTYIDSRYGSPCQALQFWDRNFWY